MNADANIKDAMLKVEERERRDLVPVFVPDFDAMNRKLHEALEGLQNQKEEVERLRRCVICYDSKLDKQISAVQTLIGEVCMLRDELDESNGGQVDG